MQRRDETTREQATKALRAAYRICADGGDVIHAAEHLRTVMDWMRAAGKPLALDRLVERVDKEDMSGTLTVIRRRGDGWRIEAVRAVGRHTDRFLRSGGGYATIQKAADRLIDVIGAKEGEQ